MRKRRRKMGDSENIPGTADNTPGFWKIAARQGVYLYIRPKSACLKWVDEGRWQFGLLIYVTLL